MTNLFAQSLLDYGIAAILNFFVSTCITWTPVYVMSKAGAKLSDSITETLPPAAQNVTAFGVLKVLKVTQSCPTLCDPMDCSLPGSSVHGILQARILEWVASPFSRRSLQPRDRTQFSCIAGRLFTI